MLVPFSYNLRSLFVRRAETLLTVVGVGATVAVLSGVLALQQGFRTLFTGSGHDDVAVFLRPGAPSESDSFFTRDRALLLIKSLPEIALDEYEQPLGSAEAYLAVRRFKVDGGETNVAIRGVQPMSFEVFDELRIVEGRRFAPGSDEVIVGKKLTGRIQDCQLGDVIQMNLTPMRVVGVFEYDGPFQSEIWGDLDRVLEATQRPGPSRVVARLKPGTDFGAMAERLSENKEVPAKALTERDYMTQSSVAMSAILLTLGSVLGLIMGVAAVFTATNTMLAALAARTHEIGILLSIGYRPFPIFLSFLIEAALLCLLGGLVGCVLVLPLNGAETGTTNFQSFTEVAFAFRVTPTVLLTAAAFSLGLGLLGGAWPAWRAARLIPTDALRHR